MSHNTHAAAIVVFVILFALVTVLGFVASRWRRAALDHINEWGLGGRRFGSIVTWFLLGGDIYTAYTFIAVPALVFGAGAQGFFALPYTVILYPIVFLTMPRLWSVAHRHGYVTPADFVRGRYGSRSLATTVAITGLLATMPYIALQLVGMRVCLQAMGIGGDWPLVIAFVILAAYTYSSGMRAPALIALVKDTLIYVTILVAVIYIPSKLGGFDNIFGAAKSQLPHHTTATGKPGAFLPGTVQAQEAFASLAFGSALALFLYPHMVTGVLSSKSADVVRRNSVVLPAYTFLLGLIALLGYMTIAAGLKPSDPNFAVPDLFLKYFPPWFEGFAFAAIVIGALVPAAIMSIAAANLFTRNVIKEFVNPDVSDAAEANIAKIVSLFVKIGALVFVLALPTKFSINLQLLGGVWILQTLPAIVVGLYTRFFHRIALVAGWAAGMALGTWMAVDLNFKSSVHDVTIGGETISLYSGVWAIALNLVISVALTLVLRAIGSPDRVDETRVDDYAEAGEVAGRREPEAVPG